MGMTYIRGAVRGPSGEEHLEFVVDSGAMYTLLPTDVWRKIGLDPKRAEAFALADVTGQRTSWAAPRGSL